MNHLILFGAPGSGKGTQSALIAETYQLKHLSTGDMLRAEIAKHSSLGQLAETYISQGKLLPDELMIDMLKDTLQQLDNDSKGIILDGFPRTVAQAEALDRLVTELHQNILLMIEIAVETPELIERLVLRGKLAGRSDDNPETIAHRLDVYHQQTEPVIDFYKQAGKYFHVNGNGTIEQIFARIRAILNSKM
ncbi:adenylate kinase [Microbacter margulisiae]|uniref:Adenylate kinase n=1 Tax=Microbacter margulisiae TaxID=1350067 RepID=A0A7W5DPE0_9PORP|nr:adenylate kinase [Microbacter margulisiae]MBB3186657.1 adenylate kinase [Microbacter margulisiae]